MGGFNIWRRQACNELKLWKIDTCPLLFYACMFNLWKITVINYLCTAQRVCVGCAAFAHLPQFWATEEHDIVPNTSPVVRHLRRDDLTLPQPRCVMGKGAAPCVWAEGKSWRRHPSESSGLTLFRVKVRRTARHPLTNNWRAKEKDWKKEGNDKTNEVRY